MIEHWPAGRLGVVSGTYLAALASSLDIDLSHVPYLHSIVHRSQVRLELLDLGLEELLLVSVHLFIELHFVVVQSLELLLPFSLVLQIALDLLELLRQVSILTFKKRDGLPLRTYLQLELRHLLNEFFVLLLVFLKCDALILKLVLELLCLGLRGSVSLLVESGRRLAVVELGLQRLTDSCHSKVFVGPVQQVLDIV